MARIQSSFKGPRTSTGPRGYKAKGGARNNPGKQAAPPPETHRGVKPATRMQRAARRGG